ncbi:hydroxyisourate hydrolase [Chromatocurvus halotolerans]|uniref:5-hydroxyisourate hydrolase n=1 Tax=Chromatocurvus halotolerans TaxID=1132028 RepID=A0A4R2KW99_9GAMM|nr:hydroxyisourate hydrolase [Chromatocurvus halotolerans]TCO78244.1 5-hydroxyisourate hydrolase [Chromatocurvus halotolerans]
MSQISTHVLDTALGQPAKGVPLSLCREESDGSWTPVADAITNRDGRVDGGLCEAGLELPAGSYRMRFNTADYLASQNLEVFYPRIDVVFHLPAGGEHYHIPLLLSPYGYSTYRGS